MSGSVNFDLLRKRLEELETLGTQATKTVNTAVQTIVSDEESIPDTAVQQLEMDFTPQPDPLPVQNPPPTLSENVPPKVFAPPRLSAKDLRRAVILSEIVGPPRSRNW